MKTNSLAAVIRIYSFRNDLNTEFSENKHRIRSLNGKKGKQNKPLGGKSFKRDLFMAFG